MQKYQKQCVSSGLDAVLAAFYLKKMHSKGAFILCIVITWHSKSRFAF